MIPCLLLALVINHEFSAMEILWTFSIYLESVALIPQLVMVIKSGETEAYIVHYTLAMALYRGLYILNWIYRYNYEGFYDIIAIVAGCLQTLVNFSIFIYIYKIHKRQKSAYMLGDYLQAALITDKQLKEVCVEKEALMPVSQLGQTELAPVHNVAKKLEKIIQI